MHESRAGFLFSRSEGGVRLPGAAAFNPCGAGKMNTAQHNEKPSAAADKPAPLGQFAEHERLIEEAKATAKLKAHADKLAEALRDLLNNELRNSDSADSPAWNRWVNARVNAQDQLTAYEAAQ